MRRLALILVLLSAAPVRADPCEQHFIAGLTAGQPVDDWITRTEAFLYTGLGWVTRRAVMDRLEDRSMQTTACQEIDVLQNELSLVERRLSQAERAFRLATSLCWGENRTRAQRNLDALDDHRTGAADIGAYLASLEDRCGG
ncbi:hypothetical protein JI664_05785 [Rhodobacter sp. NTK016B]|uniref:hypothetical protein n=1 Tax=Rhodobacter sp. NTK016B TaxID=2759676 RepID=UPI001A8FE78B|nr:hypothetical protein [Rhodobacter sp. NTK016B]MBN8291463.1 hypothetical protein [Rhodobacter sp. NTK016B]